MCNMLDLMSRHGKGKLKVEMDGQHESGHVEYKPISFHTQEGPPIIQKGKLSKNTLCDFPIAYHYLIIS